MNTIDPNLFRKNIRTKLDNILENEKQSTNLEKAVFNYAIQEASFRKIVKKWENPWFVQLYTDRLYTIYSNLKNPTILNSIKTNEWSPQTFVFMTHQEMNPELWKELLEQKSKIDASKFNTCCLHFAIFSISDFLIEVPFFLIRLLTPCVVCRDD